MKIYVWMCLISPAPSSLSINADNGTIWSSGAYINCSSDGFPIPNVIWEVVSPAGCVNSNHDQANGYAVLNVSCSGPNTWKCSASNYLGSLSKSLSFDVVKGRSYFYRLCIFHILCMLQTKLEMCIFKRLNAQFGICEFAIFQYFIYHIQIE